MLTPEQRAERLFPECTIDHARRRRTVARAIRNAENTKIRDAVRLILAAAALAGPERARMLRAGADVVRTLKTKAPRSTS